MPSPGPEPATIAQGSNETAPGPTPVRPDVGNRRPAVPAPVAAAKNPLPADSPAAAIGRRTLSTAFVMKGPYGRLTVELRDGRVLLLRDVVMRARDYCGVPVIGPASGKRHCGGYAEIAAARPGGATAPEQPTVASSHPADPRRD